MVPAADGFPQNGVERLDPARNTVGGRGQDGGLFRRDGKRIRLNGNLSGSRRRLADGGKQAQQDVFRQKRRRTAPEIDGFGSSEARGIILQLKKDAIKPPADQCDVGRRLGIKRAVIALPGAERYVDVEIPHQ